MTGIKHSEGKLFYEIDWRFVEGMARRMAANKSDKYPLFNWLEPMDIASLNAALARHFIEIQTGNFEDDGDDLGHLYAIACNAMMLAHQIKLGQKNR